MARDIPAKKREALKRWAKRKSLDVKWISNVVFTPEIEKIYLSILESALILGVLQGYMQCMKDYDIQDGDEEDE